MMQAEAQEYAPTTQGKDAGAPTSQQSAPQADAYRQGARTDEYAPGAPDPNAAASQAALAQVARLSQTPADHPAPETRPASRQGAPGPVPPATAPPAPGPPVHVEAGHTAASPAAAPRPPQEVARDEVWRDGGPASPASTAASRTGEPDEGPPGLTVPYAAALTLPQTAGLLAGALPVDLRALEQGVEDFFARVGRLEEVLPPSLSLTKLSAMLTAVGCVVAAYELGRWHAREPRLPVPGPGGGGRGWFRAFNVLPPVDES
jgi:hypothetical protein